MGAPLKQIVDNFLTNDERTSPVWESVRGHLERMLARKRVENDNSKLTDVETATLRGHIQCLKAMLALGSKPPEMTANPGSLRARQDLGAKYG